MKRTAILVTGLVWAFSAVVADEVTEASYESTNTQSNNRQAPPAAPVLLESSSESELRADTPVASDDGMTSVRDNLLRKTVVTVDGDEIGIVQDFGYGAGYGEPVAIVAIDAFIGIGEKLIAIPLSQLNSADTYSNSVMTKYTRDAIEAEEAFDEADFAAVE